MTCPQTQARIAAPHTDQTDVLAALAQLEATWIRWVAAWMTVPVLLLLGALLVSVILRP